MAQYEVCVPGGIAAEIVKCIVPYECVSDPPPTLTPWRHLSAEAQGTDRHETIHNICVVVLFCLCVCLRLHKEGRPLASEPFESYNDST